MILIFEDRKAQPISVPHNCSFTVREGNFVVFLDYCGGVGEFVVDCARYEILRTKRNRKLVRIFPFPKWKTTYRVGGVDQNNVWALVKKDHRPLINPSEVDKVIRHPVVNRTETLQDYGVSWLQKTQFIGIF